MLRAMSKPTDFADPRSLAEPVEETEVFAPKFGPDGLISVATTDAAPGRLLMFAYMNAEALGKTLDSGEAWYWSRSRNALWRKGETSGHTQRVVEIRTDCDQDAVELVVEQNGPACHTDRRSCFYRVVSGRKLAFRD